MEIGYHVFVSGGLYVLPILYRFVSWELLPDDLLVKFGVSNPFSLSGCDVVMSMCFSLATCLTPAA